MRQSLSETVWHARPGLVLTALGLSGASAMYWGKIHVDNVLATQTYHTSEFREVRKELAALSAKLDNWCSAFSSRVDGLYTRMTDVQSDTTLNKHSKKHDTGALSVYKMSLGIICLQPILLSFATLSCAQERSQQHCGAGQQPPGEGGSK